MLKANESTVDRIVRVVVGIILLYLGLGGVVTGTLGIILAIIGAILVITGIIGFCLIYRLFNFSTKKA